LFENETVYLCPSAKSDSTSVGLAQWLWSSLGAHTVKIDPREHDELLAWTSHLPHMVSTALALALFEAGIARRQLGRGGRDMARLSAGSPDVWTAIAMDNAPAITAALKGIEHQLDEFRALLESGDRGRIRERLTKARSWSGPGEH
jgi:prephenate dehydrogenase